MVRGSGKFKTKRGGGRNFSKHMVLDADGTAVPGEKDRRRTDRTDDDDEEESEEEESEEEESDSEDDGLTGGPSGQAQPELSRAERKALKKQQGPKAKAKAVKKDDDADEESEEDEDLVNPNHAMKRMNISDLNAPRELSRKEREAKEKQEAKDRYWKMHLAGKTDEAKSDLQRLAKIRAEREAAQAKRKAELDTKAAEAEAKAKAQKASQSKRAS